MSDAKKTTIPTIDAFNPDLPSVLKELEEGLYLFIIADKKKAFLYLFNKGEVEVTRKIMDPVVKKATKINSGELYGRNTKLAHHIENQLHGHIELVIREADSLIHDKHINGLFLGGHKPLFHIIRELLPHNLQDKYRGEFLTELNIPEEELITHCKNALTIYENQ